MQHQYIILVIRNIHVGPGLSCLIVATLIHCLWSNHDASAKEYFLRNKNMSTVCIIDYYYLLDDYDRIDRVTTSNMGLSFKKFISIHYMYCFV